MNNSIIRPKIMALKLKITIHYINDIISPVILIRPSLASPSEDGLLVCKLYPGAPSQPVPVHLAAAVGEYP
jgi:hypothetical protein